MSGVEEAAKKPAEPSMVPEASFISTTNAPAAPPTDANEPPLSKNALKRMRKRQAWEDGREDRAKRRKEKRHEYKVRKRTERETLISQGVDPASLTTKRSPATLVPISLILDCDFEQYMNDKERISLASQITRSYADNQKAKYKSHLWVDGWSGKLKDRFENVLANQHLNWRGVGFEEGDFLQAAVKARERMREKGGEVIQALQPSDTPALTREDGVKAQSEEPALDPAYEDVVYLSSDSPYTLQRLEPNTSYVIGGLVDKNREKGLCHRRAIEKGIRTARLPIGEFMVMQSRQVLATNHVVEIMLKWLECEDWGQAFLSVIPKRKGGVLKENAAEGEDEEGEKDDEEDVDDAENAADGETQEPGEGVTNDSEVDGLTAAPEKS
ncbi:tRNA (Guanine-1)-methyltransferase domain-containing protein [Sarocladium implicatum]|nr:tRNA (Guanine-1)-methyltransferase domain-containing protein [Sarocladium implicatum]